MPAPCHGLATIIARTVVGVACGERGDGGSRRQAVLSCASGEFGVYRDALRRALTRPNVEVKIQEDFKALGGDTLRMLEEYIARCEAGSISPARWRVQLQRRAVSRACSRGDQQSRVSSPRHEPRRLGPAVVSPRAGDFRKEPWRGSSEHRSCAEEPRRARGQTQPPPVSAGSRTPSVRAQTRNPFPGLNRFCGSNEALAHGGQRLGHTSQRLATSSRTVVTTTRLACRCVTASAH